MKNAIKTTAGRAVSLVLTLVCAVSLFGCENGGGGPVPATGYDGTEVPASGTEGATPVSPDPSSVFLGNAPISSYKIVFDGDSTCSVGAAHIIGEALFKYCGVSLRLIPDPAFTGPDEISVRE
ncbi:MAG: hypothetical protein ILP01_00845, partial [Clostridia bacterium]|nr:hypothetical protein [Clostridia bacterium]